MTMHLTGCQRCEEIETMGADGGVQTLRQVLKDAWIGAQKGAHCRGSAEG